MPSFHRTRVHWLGAGLSSGPGICLLAESGRELLLWNRSVTRADTVLRSAKSASNTQTLTFDPLSFQNELRAGDIVISMLPATMQAKVAEICISRLAHLITTCYVTPALMAFDAPARAAGLTFIHECGLYPGIDHVLAHRLVRDFKATPHDKAGTRLSFRSYCGGIPKEPGEFRYKFSWSPAGVLRELGHASHFIRSGAATTMNHAWEGVTPLTINGETFDVYPVRDSLPYISTYGLEGPWTLDTFVRGTLRPEGWKTAWKPLLDRIPHMTDADIEATGADLWTKYAYDTPDEDRAMLYVGIEARSEDNRQCLWSKAYLLDDGGGGGSFSAMSRLVSWPVTFVVDAIEQGLTPIGVSGAPSDEVHTALWMRRLNALGVPIQELKSGA